MTTPAPDAALPDPVPPGASTPGSGSRIRSLFDRIPTLWLVIAVVGVLFLSTAAFGGLEDTPADPLPQVDAGEPVAGAQLTISIDRVIVIGALPDAYLEPEAGTRLLVVTVTVENTWLSPASTLNGVGAGDNLRPAGVRGITADEGPVKVLLLADGTPTPDLQPGVPVELAYVWEVPEDSVAEGDSVRVDIFDKVYRESGFVTAGARFQEAFLAAFTEVDVEDRGTGVDPEDETAQEGNDD